MAYPEPTEVAPWYLRNITQALALDETTGNVYVRTGITGDVIIEGNVIIPGEIDAHITAVGSLGNITTPYLPIGGNVTAFQGNIPWIISNTNVAITSGNVGLTGNLAGITGNVTVNPITGSVSITGNANVAGNVGIIGNVNVTQGTTPWSVTGNITANIGGNNTVSLGGTNLDAFGRLRVSNPFTLFDTQARYYDHGQFANSISGTANVVYVSNQSSYQLNVGATAGDSVIRETVAVFPYQPGKSQLTLNTFCMSTPKTNLRQRVGLFGADNGVFFENDGTYNYFVIRSASTGVEERVRQDAWNGNQLLGVVNTNNPTGINLYPDRTQIMFADVEWLGVGSVRVGFVINGAYIICHTFNHANQTGNTKVYMTTATLPIRYEITNTGNTVSASMMTQICSSVISEGGFQPVGSPGAIGHNLGNAIVLPNDVSYLPLIAIRLKSTNLDAVVLPKNFTIAPTASSTFKYRVYRRAVTSGGTWANISATSSVQYNLAPTAIVSGDIGLEDFIITSNQTAGAPIQTAFPFEFQLERNPFTGVAYEYVLVAATTGTNENVYAAIEWQEIT